MTTSSSILSKIQPQPQPYTNRYPPRSRSSFKRRNLVRQRSDISQSRPAYSRSESQLTNDNPQSQKNNSNLPV